MKKKTVKAAPKVKPYEKRITQSDVDLDNFVMDKSRTKQTAIATVSAPDKNKPRVVQSVATTFQF